MALWSRVEGHTKFTQKLNFYNKDSLTDFISTTNLQSRSRHRLTSSDELKFYSKTLRESLITFCINIFTRATKFYFYILFCYLEINFFNLIIEL